MAMVLAKHNAIMDWRALMGPTNTLKAREIAPNRSATNSTHRQSHDNGNNFQPPHGLIIL
jgi:nucleoside diphosphate kinase